MLRIHAVGTPVRHDRQRPAPQVGGPGSPGPEPFVLAILQPTDERWGDGGRLRRLGHRGRSVGAVRVDGRGPAGPPVGGGDEAGPSS